MEKIYFNYFYIGLALLFNRSKAMKKIKSLIDKLFFKLGYIPLKSQIPIGTIIKEEQYQMLRLVNEKEIKLTQITNMIEPKIQTEIIEQAMKQELFQEATKFMEGQRIENPIRDSYQLKFILWVGKKKNNNDQVSSELSELLSQHSS